MALGYIEYASCTAYNEWFIAYLSVFLEAPRHLYNRICPSVRVFNCDSQMPQLVFPVACRACLVINVACSPGKLLYYSARSNAVSPVFAFSPKPSLLKSFSPLLSTLHICFLSSDIGAIHPIFADSDLNSRSYSRLKRRACA